MAAVSRANLRLCGSHAGVSIGEDGPSQMALEDLAMMRAVHGSTVLYPADGNATATLTETMADLPGIVYLRTTREKTPKLYDAGDAFPVGGSKTLRAGDDDRVTLVGAGVTLFESLARRRRAGRRGRRRRVIDVYSVKPIDGHDAADGTGRDRPDRHRRGPLVEGGIGDAVLEALAAGGDLSGRVVKHRRHRDAGVGEARRAARLGGDLRGQDRGPGPRDAVLTDTYAPTAGSGGMATGVSIRCGRVNAGADSVRHAMTAAITASADEPA